MKNLLYEEVVNEIFKLKKRRDECVECLKQKFPSVSLGTFSSIYSQIYQRKTKKDFPKHHRKTTIAKYVQQYHISIANKEHEGFVYRLAESVDFPPTLIARIILEEVFKDNPNLKVTKAFISQCMKKPEEIPDKILSQEVGICIQNDQLCGPIIESMKHEIGLKYEKVLHDCLKQRDILYYHEDVLRKEGYDKTPDFKLVVPILVDNHVIHWIESKALFGDHESHSGYLENQFWSYTNRFGPGLVIYWFGFIDELDINLERGVMLKDEFPSNIITLESLLDDDYENFSIASF